MRAGAFRKIGFTPAARAQRGDHFVGTKSRVFSDRHIAYCWRNFEWVYETGYILSPFDEGDHVFCDVAVRLQKAGPEDLQTIGASAGIRTPHQQIMRRGKGHQQGETKRDNPVFNESAAVKVSYILLRLST